MQEDSVEHYCRCSAVMQVAEGYLRFSIPRERALNLWLLNEHALDQDRVLLSLALLVYGVYMTTNYGRHRGKYTQEAAKDAIRQHIMQGARGCHIAEHHLDSRWQHPIAYLV